MRKIAIVSPGSLPSSRQALITPRATMSTRVLETIDIITAIFSTPSFSQHLLGQAAGLRDRGVAADLGVVGGLAALAADRVGERQRAAAGADHEAEVAVEAVVLALDHAAVVGGVDRLHVALEVARARRARGARRGRSRSPRSSLLVAADRLVLHLHVGVEGDEAAVGEPGERVDLGQGHVVVAHAGGRGAARTGVARLSSEPVTPVSGRRPAWPRSRRSDAGSRGGRGRRGRGASRRPPRCRSRPCR